MVVADNYICIKILIHRCCPEDVLPIQLAVTCIAVRNIFPLQREPIVLPFGKHWNVPAAKGTNSAAVIRQVLVHPTAAACYKLKQLPKSALLFIPIRWEWKV